MLAAESVVRSYSAGYDELGSLFSRFVKGVFDINADCYVDSGVPFLRILNLRYGVIEENNLAFIAENRHQEEIKTELRRGDIVLSKTAYPSASVVTLDRCNTSQDTIATSLSQFGKTNYRAEAVSAYLNSEFGRRLLWRQFQGNVQLHLSLDDGRKVPIPRLGGDLQEMIAKAYQRACQLREESSNRITQAELGLLHVLGLDGWEAPLPLTYIRNSRDAFGAGRLNAEYFHPAKTEALDKLKALSDCTVGELFASVRELWQPDDDDGPDVVRNYDLTDALSPFLDGEKEPCERTAISSTKKVVRAGDLVVSRLRFYLKEIAIVQAGKAVPMVASTEFIVLRPIQPGRLPIEALLIFLRSLLPQIVFKWSQDGSNHPRFDEKELLRLPVPRELLRNSGAYVAALQSVIAKRERAAQLLDAAKRAVEIAIEDSEVAALDFLNTRCSGALAHD